MAYNQDLPADTTAPVEIRENFRALKEDKIVAAASANTADRAVKLENVRTISLTGDATGSATFDGSADMSISVDVTSADIAATCTGNAATSTKLETARAINGVDFDGTTDITITQVNGKNIATVDQIPSASVFVPLGGIIMWSGTIATIPGSYTLCNGNNGTPDLRNRFIVGAGTDSGSGYVNSTTEGGSGTFRRGDHGGQGMHKLTIAEMPSANGSTLRYGYTDYNSGTGSAGLTMVDNRFGSVGILLGGGDQPHNIMPPYYALAYIMRIA